MSASASDSRRYEFLDGLRAIAALVVVVHHAELEVWLGSAADRGNYIGRISVDVFIVLSGFCLTLPVLRTGGRLAAGALDFFRRRARRILPPYYGALALSLVLIWFLIGAKTGTRWDVSVPATRNGIIANLLLIQNVFHRYEINYSFWSIAMEWQIYFFFPLYLIGWRRLGLFWTTLLVVAVSLGAYAPLQSTFLAEVTVNYFGLFALGMLSAQLAFSRQDRLPWRSFALASWLVVGALIWLGWGLHITAPRGALLDTLVGVATALLLVSAARHPDGITRRVLSIPLLARIGTFSYSLYLLHAPLLQLIWLYVLHPLGLSPRLTYALLVGLGCPAILLASYLFFIFLERPFMKRRAPAAALGAAVGS